MNTAWDLFVHELKDMLNAENRLLHALGEMERESNISGLQEAYRNHRKETEQHAQRLVTIMRDIGETPEQTECRGIEGLIEEKMGFMKRHPSEDVIEVFNLDAGIKSERYEISSYESLIRLAQELGAANALQLLRENLHDEEQALAKLEVFANSVKPLQLGVKGNVEGKIPRKAA